MLLRASSDAIRQTTTSAFVLRWGKRKRLRCMKVQVKDDSTTPVQRTTARVDRRVVRSDKDSSKQTSDHNNTSNNYHTNGYPNLRQRPSSPQHHQPQRILRYSISLQLYYISLRLRWQRVAGPHGEVRVIWLLTSSVNSGGFILYIFFPLIVGRDFTST